MGMQYLKRRRVKSERKDRLTIVKQLAAGHSQTNEVGFPPSSLQIPDGSKF